MIWIALIIGLYLFLFSAPKSARQEFGLLIIVIVAGCWAFALLYWAGKEAVVFWNGPAPGAIGEAILGILRAICMTFATILYVCFWIVVGPFVVMFLGFFRLFSKILK